jgi:PHAX RNA-binding domain
MSHEPAERVRALYEHRAVARTVAAELGETGYVPKMMIARLAKALGVDFVQRHAERAKVVESQGGLLCGDGTRRTLGGVFFFLMRQELGSKRFNQVASGKDKTHKAVTATEPTEGSVNR